MPPHSPNASGARSVVFLAMKIDRLLSIVIMMLNRDRIPAAELARRFEVSVRTIYRDIDAINLAGIPVVSFQGNNGGLGIHESYRLDRQALTLADMVSILSALRSVSAAIESVELETAIEKVQSLVPKEKRTEVDELQEQIVVDILPWGYRAREKELMKDIHGALRKRRVIDLTYRTYGGESSARLVEPMTLVYKGSGWYLYGFCRLRADYRLFRLSRIQELKIRTETFTRRSGSYTGYSGRSIPMKTIAITLRCSPRAAASFEDYLEPERIVPDGDKVRVIAEWPDDGWTYSMLLGMGADAEVLEPEGVRRELARRVRLMAEKYRDDFQT
jgi:predicted DNA-binding transcriptional regulator YafY